jgi:hypothetical protein
MNLTMCRRFGLSCSHWDGKRSCLEDSGVGMRGRKRAPQEQLIVTKCNLLAEAGRKGNIND